MRKLIHHHRSGRTWFRFIALVLAFTYFGFRTEILEREYDDAHPKTDGTCAISGSSLNWETFDKDNAPQAFTFTVSFRIAPFVTLVPAQPIDPAGYLPFRLTRDKSPPIPPSQV